MDETEGPNDFPRDHLSIGRTAHGWAVRETRGNITTTRFGGSEGAMLMALMDWVKRAGGTGA